jgi:hypothetical protein
MKKHNKTIRKLLWWALAVVFLAISLLRWGDFAGALSDCLFTLLVF